MIIAVSGLSGSGKTTVANVLAKRLGLKAVTTTLRDLALRMHLSLEEALARRAELDLDRKLDEFLVNSAKKGNCVVASRLACWLLPDADLKVWLAASPEVRARRIAIREHKIFTKVLEETKKRDARDIETYKRIYGWDISKHDFCFIVNTDALSADEVSEAIIKRATQK